MFGITKDQILAFIKYLPYLILTGIIIWLLLMVLGLKSENTILKITNTSLTTKVENAKELQLREKEICDARIQEAINKIKAEKADQDINETLSNIPNQIEPGDHKL